MITEKRFALSHFAFWEQLIPMAEHYIRRRNIAPDRYILPLASSVAASSRGLVNEIGFRIFAASIERAEQPRDIPDAVIDKCVNRAVQHISLLRQHARKPVQSPEELIAGLKGQGRPEACSLAERLVLFFNKAEFEYPVVAPRFPGCGWLNECEGDIIAGDTLFEVKAGRRAFRSADVRQLLCYCALSFSSKSHEVRSICLVNPRMGTYLQDSLENICQELSGRSAVEVLAEIVEYMSEPSGRYWTG